MPSEKVLIVEDDPTLLEALKDNFLHAGYCVEVADDGEKGLDAALNSNADLILLDIMLPKINGYEICRQVRERQLDVIVIMLTAKGQESDIILGLNLGADDYVTKPFGIKELLARVNAFLRRHRRVKQRSYKFGDCEFDGVSYELTRNGQHVQLTPKELSLLQYLVEKTDRALSRDQILNAVWGHSVFVTTRSVDRCITTLRGKIEADPHQPRFIKTIREIGYRFEMPET